MYALSSYRHHLIIIIIIILLLLLLLLLLLFCYELVVDFEMLSKIILSISWH